MSVPAPVPSRRAFLKTAGIAGGAALAGGGLLLLPAGVLRGANAPSNRIRVAGIGVGGMGGANIGGLAGNGAEIAVICDVDEKCAAGARRRFPKAKFFRDYREMLATAGGDFDAVMVATPDHTHAAIGAAAIRAGKHTFIQKPLAHDIHECRELARLAREKNVVTQMGIQGRVMLGHWRVKQWVAAGIIGDITGVEAWCDLSYYPWGHAAWSTRWGRKPAEKPPVPASLDWNLWLGPAPERPYHRAYHPGTWRAWWDFGNGMMGDRGAHTLDVVFDLLGRRMPDEIDATSCGLNPDTHPLSAIITFRMTGADGKPPFKLTWYEGTRPPRPPELPDRERLPDEGGFIIRGTKGAIVGGVYSNNPRLLPLELRKAHPVGKPPTGAFAGSIERDFLDAIRAGKKAAADFDYSARLTEFTMLGNLAKRADGKILWDEAAMRVTNNDAANAWVRCPRRKGWEL